MSTLYITYGPTHSGKTTFGKKLHDKLSSSSKIIHVDNDVVDSFINENYPNLRNDEEILATRTPDNPDLRLRIPQLIVDYALTENYSVIVTASHPRKTIRDYYYELAKQHDSEIVLLILREPDEVINQRIKEAGRTPELILGFSSFEEFAESQKDRFEEPDKKERARYEHVYEINPDNTDEIIAQIVK